jgi:haloalkane dehalogenase
MVTGASSIPDWLARLYPFSPKRFVTQSGARMSYVDEGPRTTEAVLMLHGNPTWSFFYRDVIKQLSPEMRCIAPDHIGMGLSEKPENYSYSLEARISDIQALVSSLGLTKVHLIVHDWGGAIGFGLATRAPDLIGRITILNTAAFVSNEIPFRISLCRLPWVGDWLVRGLNGFAYPAIWMSMHRRRLSPNESRGFLFPYRSWRDRVAVSAFVKDIPLEADHLSRRTLAAIEAGLPKLSSHPILIVWGMRDFCFNEKFLARWRQIYKGMEVHELNDVGHYVLDDGGASVREKICTFFRRG